MIPDALKPAICPTCHGRGHIGCRICDAPGYGPDLDGHTPDYEPCPLCGGSGINPDMIHDKRRARFGDGQEARAVEVPWRGSGRYVVIPLGEPQ